MAVIWETTDRFARLVRLTDAGWEHVQERHRDLIARQDEIRDAVTLADEIARDRAFRHREIHYRRYGSDKLWLRVVVNYRPTEHHGWVGIVITGHFTGVRYESEVLIWPP